MSLCLFKGQENRWPRFLRHGFDLSQWHLYQSRLGFVLCLTARHICLSRSRPRTEAVHLLSNVSLHFMSADRVIHKELQNEMKTTWEAKSIKGGKMIIEKDLSVCCKAAKPGKKNEKPSLSSLNTHKESNSIIFWQLFLQKFKYYKVIFIQMWYCLVSIILGNAGWNECIMQNRKSKFHLFLLICVSYKGWNTCIIFSRHPLSLIVLHKFRDFLTH